MNKKIYLAGGCFWGVEAYFSRLKGVVNAISGYANGIDTNATYKNLKNTMHAETVEVEYDSSVISLRELVIHLFRLIEPDSYNKQGNDIGPQYRTGVYFNEESEFDQINSIFNILRKKYRNFYVELEPLRHFIHAEEYHQDYLDKNPNGYCHVNLNVDLNLSDEERAIIEKSIEND